MLDENWSPLSEMMIKLWLVHKSQKLAVWLPWQNTVPPYDGKSTSTCCHGLTNTTVTIYGSVTWLSAYVTQVAQAFTYFISVNMPGQIRSLALLKQVLMPSMHILLHFKSHGTWDVVFIVSDLLGLSVHPCGQRMVSGSSCLSSGRHLAKTSASVVIFGPFVIFQWICINWWPCMGCNTRLLIACNSSFSGLLVRDPDREFTMGISLPGLYCIVIV